MALAKKSAAELALPLMALSVESLLVEKLLGKFGSWWSSSEEATSCSCDWAMNEGSLVEVPAGAACISSATSTSGRASVRSHESVRWMPRLGHVDVSSSQGP